MVQNLKIKQFALLVAVAFVLFGCARGKEFSVVERDEVLQNKAYPEFTKPKAATNQFTDEEKEKLTKRLDAEKRMVQGNAANAASQDNAGGATSVNDVRREAEDVLRQIEQGTAQ